MTDPAGTGGEGGSGSNAPGVATGPSRMLADVREGLRRTPKRLSSTYFYDRRGSELFEEITRLPEYYLTRAEIEILRGPVKEWIRRTAPGTLVELGAGSGRKTRILLEGLGRGQQEALYVPVDVSADFLEEAARRLDGEFPGVRVEPVVADMTDDLSGLDDVPRPAVFALLGSTIGNFKRPAARDLLARIRDRMDGGDALLMGADLRPRGTKPVEVLEAAYDDEAGVTAEFNRNILRVLNRELGTDFDPEGFRHRAVYDEDEHRIEMYLVCGRADVVRLPDGTRVSLEAGEPIRTEISCKYDRQTVEEMVEEVGLTLDGWHLDGEERYALAVASPGGAGG